MQEQLQQWAIDEFAKDVASALNGEQFEIKLNQFSEYRKMVESLIETSSVLVGDKTVNLHVTEALQELAEMFTEAESMNLDAVYLKPEEVSLLSNLV